MTGEQLSRQGTQPMYSPVRYQLSREGVDHLPHDPARPGWIIERIELVGRFEQPRGGPPAHDRHGRRETPTRRGLQLPMTFTPIRDPNMVMAALRTAMAAHPDQRVMQVIVNALGEDPFYIEDDKAARLLCEYAVKGTTTDV